MILFALLKDRKKFFNDRIIRDLSTKTGTKISKTADGDLEIEGEGGSEYFADLVLQGINYGFEYKKAIKLLNDEYFLEIIDLEQAMWGKKTRIAQMKGRLIGTQGKAKHTLEFLTDCWLSVSGDKVALLGKYEDLKFAKEGVLQLLEGKTHGTVYAFLEKKKAQG